MRNTARLVLGASVVSVLLSGLVLSLAANAIGEMPDKTTCATTKDPVIAGGCLATDRNKGNCMACHKFEGLEEAQLPTGNIAPPLVAMKARYPEKKRLREQIWDATQFNPRTSMPPYGKHGILTEKEIDLVIEWLYSL